MLALFGMGSFLMRGAACIINDLWDRDIDGKVARTKFRPLASGAVSQTEAIGWLGLHLTAALPIVFSLNYYSVALAFSSVVPVILYPMMKRFTHWPQLWLGITINWGVLVGYSAVKGHLDASVLPLYAACICWTIIYDTIYAHQDKKDDVKIGVKSTALLFGSQTKPWMALFSTSMCLGGTAAGILSQQTWPYFATFYGSLAVLGWQIWKLNLDNENECLKVFKSSWWIGLALFTGICLSNLLKQS
ncbi:4-hydroxybenzoate polyprenyltransferase, mitochondrial-like [Oscarella lobularis]|uniref:4-hydroxybenzoate polyprenyltransferase, mitochondrial-like n=1 Tax=Oscarella lobularis TaxID=121494 RepID=UPI0033138F11